MQKYLKDSGRRVRVIYNRKYTFKDIKCPPKGIVGSTMFTATFNLVTRVRLPLVLEWLKMEVF